jgi:pimeloyl-ACP methyl ester carboxylesterase
MRLHPSVNEIEPVQWQHHAAGQEVDIEARLLTNARWLETGQPSLLMIPGYGEGEWAAQQALKYFTSIGKRATVALVDTSQTPASLEDVTTFAHDFAPQVVSQLQTRGVLPEKATVLGHSMGGGILSLGVQEAPELFGSIGLLEPIGNDTAAQILIQPDQAKRERAFKRRFARVVIGPYMHANPNELLHAGLDISRQLAKDFRPFSHRFRDKIALTAGSDGMPAVIEHAADGNAVAYVLGGKDPLVKPSMILGSIYYHFQTENIPT